MNSREVYDAIYSVVSSIPHGRVATYGQVAEVAGLPGRARLVGYALKVLPEGSGVPWHRVVNARGEISSRGTPAAEHEQKLLLETEGIVLNGGKRLSLKRFQWETDD